MGFLICPRTNSFILCVCRWLCLLTNRIYSLFAEKSCDQLNSLLCGLEPVFLTRQPQGQWPSVVLWGDLSSCINAQLTIESLICWTWLLNFISVYPESLRRNKNPGMNGYEFSSRQSVVNKSLKHMRGEFSNGEHGMMVSPVTHHAPHSHSTSRQNNYSLLYID